MVCQFHAADALGDGACECPSFVAEQLASRRVGMAAQLSLTNVLSSRGLRLWMARAISSFPVPVSP